jgi:hypothetical protein
MQDSGRQVTFAIVAFFNDPLRRWEFTFDCEARELRSVETQFARKATAMSVDSSPTRERGTLS